MFMNSKRMEEIIKEKTAETENNQRKYCRK